MIAGLQGIMKLFSAYKTCRKCWVFKKPVGNAEGNNSTI
jgi:hypothetical protein